MQRDSMAKVTVKVFRWALDEPVALPDGTAKHEETTIDMINFILNAEAREMGGATGFDEFRRMRRLAIACDEANNSIVFETEDYDHLVYLFNKHIPASWGLNPKLSEAIEDFVGDELNESD